MNIRFTMFPFEGQLLPIYERLIARPERSAARTLRSLLHHLDSSGLPQWFEQMPRKPFPGTRGRTIRMTLPKPQDDPALASLYQKLIPLQNAERLNAIKEGLLSMVNSSGVATLVPPIDQQMPQRTPELMPQQSTSLALIPPRVSTNQFEEDSSAKARKQATIKNASASYR